MKNKQEILLQNGYSILIEEYTATYSLTAMLNGEELQPSLNYIGPTPNLEEIMTFSWFDFCNLQKSEFGAALNQYYKENPLSNS